MTDSHPLTDSLQRLHQLAARARSNAYVPYSGFSVGAALRMASGETVTGCNVENASYGLAICAERAAMTRAISAGHGTQFAEIAIDVDGEQGMPCGMCRQFMAEFNPHMPVAYRSGGELVVRTVSELLADPFLPGALPSR